MNGPPYRRWMYNRLLPDRGGYRQEFSNEVNQFDEFSRRQAEFLNGEKYRCPCAKCRNGVYKHPMRSRCTLCIRVLLNGIGFG